VTLALTGLGILLDVSSLVLGALPLEAGERVYPSRGNGFAAAIVGALVALGLLVLMMMFTSSKPRNRRR
jgi:hypothetical protein